MTGTGMLVGFGHRAQVGKDTAASMAGLRPYSFAQVIRNIAVRTNPFIREAGERLNKMAERRDWEQAKARYPEVRVMLQDLGLALRRELGAGVLADALMVDMKYRLDSGLACAITDVRFPNEIHAIRDLGGVVVRIDRAKAPKLDHPSECALDDWSDWDHVIENNGSLAKLEATVQALFRGS